MSLLSPEQLEALKKVLGPASQSAVVLRLPLDTMKAFLNKVVDFVTENAATLERSPYLLVLDTATAGGEPLTAQIVNEATNRGKSVLFVDLAMCVIAQRDGEARASVAASVTQSNTPLGILVQGGYVQYVLVGKVIEDLNLRDPAAGAPLPSFLHRPVREFDQLIDDHKRHCLDREQAVRYWQDKRNRILLATPDKTEAIFHRSVLWWIKQYARDAIKVYSNPCGPGEDRTDIVMVTLAGGHVVEIKWLGKNEHNTEYGQEQINVGLRQTGIYLTNDPTFVCGYLVAYDGRPHHVHLAQSSYDDRNCHLRCKPPIIVFLDSEAPSVTAQTPTDTEDE